FDAVVLHVDDHGAEVMLVEPPVIARCQGVGLREGAQVQVHLDSVEDVVTFSYAGEPA
ncbi:MAG: hypothetical protein QOJ72_1578, partial [Nocardioidaceae bacterium]|nr:hypothetical protein [Nocardioidaceae bacterium]